jgi:hypothetical protein
MGLKVKTRIIEEQDSFFGASVKLQQNFSRIEKSKIIMFSEAFINFCKKKIVMVHLDLIRNYTQ